MKRFIGWIKAKLNIRSVVRCLHRRMMNCANCGIDYPCGLPIDCGYKDDFIRISHREAKDLYCPMWTEKENKMINDYVGAFNKIKDFYDLRDLKIHNSKWFEVYLSRKHKAKKKKNKTKKRKR